MLNSEFENLVSQLTRINGLTKRSAQKIATDLIKASDEQIDELVNAIDELRSYSKACLTCNLVQSKVICDFCLNQNRMHELMIFESTNNVFKFNAYGDYHGYYFVSDPLLKTKNKHLDLGWENKLVEMVESKKIKDVIFALSPTIAGEITMKYIKALLINSEVNFSRFAVGMPINSEVDYMDEATLKNAYKNRTKE